MSDRLVVMNKGRVVQVGTPHEIYERPRSPFVAEFMGRSNFLKGRVLAVESGSCAVQTETGLVIQVEDVATFGTGDQVLVQLRAERLQLHLDQPDLHNSLPVEIVRRTFLGTRTEFHVRSSLGDQLAISASAGHPGDVGQNAWVSIPPTETILVPATEEV